MYVRREKNYTIIANNQKSKFIRNREEERVLKNTKIQTEKKSKKYIKHYQKSKSQIMQMWITSSWSDVDHTII
jgi:hypothetical protein